MTIQEANKKLPKGFEIIKGSSKLYRWRYYEHIGNIGLCNPYGHEVFGSPFSTVKLAFDNVFKTLASL